MILVDTSVWVDHLRSGDAALSRLLDDGAVLAHSWVTGELSLGSLSRREEVLGLLRGLPQAVVAEHDEVMLLIERHALHATGIGYVDVHLLAAGLLTPDTTLWTRDRRLSAAAARLGLEHLSPGS